MQKKTKWILATTNFMSIAAFILSIFVLINSSTKTNVDHLAFLIGVLAIITTVLIGWQIFTLIDLKTYQSNFRDLSNDSYDEICRIKGFSHLSYAHSNIAWLTPATKEKWFFEYITNSISALSYFSKANEYNTCWLIVSELIDNIKNGDKSFSQEFKKRKNEWILSLNEVENIAQIRDYKKLVETINEFEHDDC